MLKLAVDKTKKKTSQNFSSRTMDTVETYINYVKSETAVTDQEMTSGVMAKIIRHEPVSQKFHFKPSTDVMLLREVLASQPFLARHGEVDAAWKAVAEKMKLVNLFADFRTYRERFNLLLKKFHKEDMQSIRRSGTEEEFTERESLLSEIHELKVSCENQKREMQDAQAKADRDKAVMATQIRQLAMVNMKRKRSAMDRASTSNADATNGDAAAEQISSDEATTTGAEVMPSLGITNREGGTQATGGRNAAFNAMLQSRERLWMMENETKNRKLSFEEDQLQFLKRKLEFDERKFEADEKQRQMQNNLLTTVLEKVLTNTNGANNCAQSTLK